MSFQTKVESLPDDILRILHSYHVKPYYSIVKPTKWFDCLTRQTMLGSWLTCPWLNPFTIARPTA